MQCGCGQAVSIVRKGYGDLSKERVLRASGNGRMSYLYRWQKASWDGVGTHLSICSAWWAQRMAGGGGHGPAPSLFTPGCWRIVEDALQCGLMFVPSFLISSPKGASRHMTHHHCPQSSWETSVSSSARLSEVHSDFLFQVRCFCEASLLRLA